MDKSNSCSDRVPHLQRGSPSVLAIYSTISPLLFKAATEVLDFMSDIITLRLWDLYRAGIKRCFCPRMLH